MADKKQKDVKAIPCDPYVKRRIKRGKEHAHREKPIRQECAEFVRGNQYVYRPHNAKELERQATTPGRKGDGKPSHRVRKAHNMLAPVVQQKVSAATQRTPSYSVTPSTQDAEAFAAASLSEKIALAGHDRWGVQEAAERTAWNALVMDEGFGMAYWDGQLGPYATVSETDEEGNIVSEEVVPLGDVRVWTGNANQVFWEPGIEFEESRWYGIIYGRPVDSLSGEPGFLGGRLSADAQVTDETGTESPDDEGNLVMVTEYFERPSEKHPEGRHLVVANDRVIFEPGEYPKRDANGKVRDEPLLHRVYYFMDAASDRQKGFVRFAIDPQRTLNMAVNKAEEWVQVAIVPQLLAEENTLITPPTDEPGSVVTYRPSPGNGPPPQWRQVPPPPKEVFELADRARAEIGFIAHSNDIPSQVEAGKAIEAMNERDRIAWQHFVIQMARFYAGIMRDCLCLVQRFYTEERVMEYRGLTGWEPINDFKGADIGGQTSVRVAPDSIEARTRQAIEQRVMSFAQLGWIGPEAAMSAIASGSGEKLIETMELDQMRAHKVIQMIRAGVFWEMPSRPVFPGEMHPDPDFDPQYPPGPNNPELLTEVPGWMPRPHIDNVAVHKKVFGDWLKTSDFEMQDEKGKQAGYLYFQALLDFERKEAEQVMLEQAAQAEQMGMNNATRPSEPGKPLPSLPAVPA